MRAKQLNGQLSLDLFDKPKHEPPNYPKPCPIREDCGAYHCETGGCSGERGWCGNALRSLRVPGNCPHEQSTVDIGGGKSLCELLGAWTNCREMGHCVYEQIRKR